MREGEHEVVFDATDNETESNGAIERTLHRAVSVCTWKKEGESSGRTAVGQSCLAASS